MYTALYRAERPEVFSEILGQEHIVKILKRQIATDTVSHAYLFCGTRGTGKTTTARILAKAVNCLAGDGDQNGESSESGKPCGVCPNCQAIKDGTFMDVIEIDAASNNGVENIRELRESVKYPPAVGRKKVYIIDEVHMLSTGAFNALLKTLEEPPADVMFILATTEPQKLPATILSRCMRLDFKRVAEAVLRDGFKRICDDKNVDIDESALALLASNADGSVRDGLSILDQCLATGERSINRDMVIELLGTESEEFFLDLTDLVALHNTAEALVRLDGVLREGKDVKQLMKDWMSHYRNLLISKYIRNPEDMLNMTTEGINRLKEQSNQISLDEIDRGIVTLSKTINEARFSTQPRILLELAIVTLSSEIMDEMATPRMVAPPIKTAAPARAVTSARTAAPTSTQMAPARTAAPQPADAGSEAEITPASNPANEAARVMVEEPASETFLEGQAETDPGKKGPAETDVQNGSVDMGLDLDAIWHEIFEEGECAKGSFNIIRVSTTLEHVGESDFTVAAANEITKTYLENNRAVLENLMEKKIGRRLAMRCSAQSKTEDLSKQEMAEKIARDVADSFKIDVEIE